VEFKIVAGRNAFPEKWSECQEADDGDRQPARDGTVQQRGKAILLHSKLSLKINRSAMTCEKRCARLGPIEVEQTDRGRGCTRDGV